RPSAAAKGVQRQRIQIRHLICRISRSLEFVINPQRNLCTSQPSINRSYRIQLRLLVEQVVNIQRKPETPVLLHRHFVGDAEIRQSVRLTDWPAEQYASRSNTGQTLR